MRPYRCHYLDRERNTGDLHGQAPPLWCALALLRLVVHWGHLPMRINSPFSLKEKVHTQGRGLED